MNKRLTITGSTLRGRSYDFKKQLAQEVPAHVWPLIEAGKFRPVYLQNIPARGNRRCTPVAGRRRTQA